ncbi:hypothetical protein BH20BAC1_BH20BAC1_09950 [soil metagenome]
MNENPRQSPGKNEEENLKNENEFLKMKLMLEHGAEFETPQTKNDLPAEAENEFLNYIMEFEKQAAERKTIKVFDRIERPHHFKAVDEIMDDEIDAAWDELGNYLNKYNIDLAVCSPNIDNRELYRFVTEELFDYEMNDIFIPGGMTCFTYDEFYPDHKYDNTRYAVDDSIKLILKKSPLDLLMWFRKENLTLNNHCPLTEKKFKEIINRFKELYEDIRLNDITNVDCVIDDNICHVRGMYDVTLVLPGEEINLKGKWIVEFELHEEFGFWQIGNIVQWQNGCLLSKGLDVSNHSVSAKCEYGDAGESQWSVKPFSLTRMNKFKSYYSHKKWRVG